MTSVYPKPTLVSRTAFDTLAVDEGEESDSEEPSPDSPEPPLDPSLYVLSSYVTYCF